MPFMIGIRPYGHSSLIIQQDVQFEDGEFKQGDRIVSVAGKSISSIADLRKVLNEHIGEKVPVTALRHGSEKLTFHKTVEKKELLLLKNIYDIQTKQTIDKMEIGAWDKQKIQKIYIDGNNYSTWDDLKKAIQKHLKEKGEKLSFRIGAVEVQAKIQIEKRGMLGILLSEGLQAEKANLPSDLISSFSRTWNQAIFTTKSTLVGLYRIIEGKISFQKNISGPVKIAAIAAESVKHGWDYYWFLLAQITIVLGIMNILPIPVLDGGHILFYTIEAVYKPVPLKTMMSITRIFMLVLITFGLYVIFQDIADVFFR
ncbi:MAG: hypothetical protein D6767_09790 [Candidatus Hydrogenedentota bacterium]|nr:MAG: hypothetical protein D6767_09790 [Candidatus Hydrogenedentota bacterium]